MGWCWLCWPRLSPRLLLVGNHASLNHTGIRFKSITSVVTPFLRSKSTGFCCRPKAAVNDNKCWVQRTPLGLALRRLLRSLICKESHCCVLFCNTKSSSSPPSTVLLKLTKIGETLITVFLHLEVQLEATLMGRQCLLSSVQTGVIAG